MKNRKRGFTLIELLVVVLIIGILAAVALPQYQVAVGRSRVASWLPFARSILDANQRYYLANGQYTNDLEALDVNVPYSGKSEQTASVSLYKGTPLGTFSLDATSGCVFINNSAASRKENKIDVTVDFCPKSKKCYGWTEAAERICKSLGPAADLPLYGGKQYYYLEF